MNRIDELIDRLASDARPLRPLTPPFARALAWLGAMVLVSAPMIMLFGDGGALLTRYEGREQMMALEMAAMLATGVLARIWRGWTTHQGAAEYEQLLVSTILPGIEVRAVRASATST